MRIRLLALAAFGAAGLLRGQGCETQIIGTEPTLIEPPAQALVVAGADVRVRVTLKPTAATLEAAELSFEAHCPSWQAPGGGRKQNLIVVLVTEEDRKGAIFFGAQWKPALQSRKAVIESDILSSHLQQNDIPGGIAAALAEMHSLIENPPPASAGANEEPLPELSSSFSWIAIVAVGLVGGAALLWFFRHRLAQARTERDRRAAAQQAAISAQQQATRVYEEVSALDTSTNPAAKAAIVAAGQALHGLGTGLGDPAVNTLTVAQYQAIAQQYESVALELKRTQTILTGKVQPGALSVDQAMSLIIDNNRRTRQR